MNFSRPSRHYLRTATFRMSLLLYRDEAVRDAFITGLQSNTIRQCLLENSTLELGAMFTQARSLDTAQKNSESYTSSGPPSNDPEGNPESTLAAVTGPKCYFCGYSKHPHHKCPAKDATCKRCQKRGHFAKVCRSNPAGSQLEQGSAGASVYPTLAAVPSSTPPTLLKSSSKVTIDGVSARALIDSCSTESFIHLHLAETLNLQRYPDPRDISMAQSTLSAKTLGHYIADLELGGKTYSNLRLSILARI